MILSKFISAILKNSRREVTVNGSGRYDPRTASDVAPYGIDSCPPQEGWTAIYANTGADDAQVLLGYVNEKAIAEYGNTRIYSAGNLDIKVKSNNTIEIGGNAKNMVRFQELEAGFNQLVTNFNNHVAIFNAHIHPGVVTATGAPVTVSPSVTPSVPSTASIAAAKINEIKTL